MSWVAGRRGIVVAMGVATALLATVTTLGSAQPAHAVSRPWADANEAPDIRAQQVLSQMTLVEKISLMQGISPGYFGYDVPGIARLGIPAQLMLNNGNGVNVQDPAVRNGTSTALPSATALGATFDPALAKSYGTLIGHENHESGSNILLGPAGDLLRQPFWGRSFESFGEDPYVAAQMSAAEIQGIQATPGEIATAKHPIVYNSEPGRGTNNVVVSEKALQEVYLQPLKADVVQGHVGTAMCSFSQVNGTPACQDSDLLNNTLRKAWNFEGWVMSDYGATHSTVASLNAGLNQDQVGPDYYDVSEVEAALTSGQVTQSTVDTLVFEILRTMFAYGLFDHPATISQTLPAADKTAAAAVSVAGSVLLKNQDGALPLTSATKSIAVIGDAATHMPQGGGSGNVKPYSTTNVVQALQARVGTGATVSYSQGYDPVNPASDLPNSSAAVGSSVFAPSSLSTGTTGLTGQYWDNGSFQGTATVTRTDKQPKFENGFASWTLGSGFDFVSDSSQIPIPAQLTDGPVSMQWIGTFTAPTTGAYTFTATNNGNAVLHLDNQTIVSSIGNSAVTSAKSTVQNLVKGQRYPFKLTFQRSTSGSFDPAEIGLSWTHPAAAQSPMIAQAVAQAKKASVAIVVVRDYETESQDRASLALPNEQDALVSAVAAANPNTIVVLASNGPVLMPWLGQVKGVLDNFYGGEAWGTAITQILYGDVDPSGKLPFTFPTSDTATPVSTPQQYPGVDGTITYSEGVFVGYRGYQNSNITPLFSFGYGLSYTSFAEKGLTVTKTAANTYRATLKVTNTGTRSGSEVVQAYLHDPQYLIEPSNMLKAFAKVSLVPGQTKTVTLTLTPESFETYSSSADALVVQPGVYQLRVGNSLTNNLLQAKNIVIG